MTTTPRHDGRQPDQLRPFTFKVGIAPHAAGSVLASCGNTQVICTVMVQEEVPRWMKDQKVSGGWLTTEYSMLPYSTLERKPRDRAKGQADGRTIEIQRLIGRVLRTAVDLEKVGARTLMIDCDVLQADGGTRTTSITGAYVALALAVKKLQAAGKITESPLCAQVAAISVGLCQGRPLLDLDYLEDKDAEVDMNLAMTATGRFVEVQAGGEESTFTPAELSALLALGEKGLKEIFALQNQAIGAV
jgi:ribonuclease PH